MSAPRRLSSLRVLGTFLSPLPRTQAAPTFNHTRQLGLLAEPSNDPNALVFGRYLVWCPRNNYTFAAMDFGRRLGASDEHIPQWICKERATTPPPKRHAALWVALKLAWGFVAQSVEYRWGYTPSLAPRPRPI